LQISYLQKVVVFGQAFERNGGSMVGAVNDETSEEQPEGPKRNEDKFHLILK
jgi:hypothetical protein